MIYIISPDYITLPAEKYGGIERVLVNLADGLNRLSVDVLVLCRTSSPDIDYLMNMSSGDTKNLSVFNLKYHTDDYVNVVLDFIKNNVTQDDTVFINHIEQKVFVDSIRKKTNRLYEIVHYRNTALRSGLIFPSRLYNAITTKSGVVIPHPTSENEFYPVIDEKPIIDGDYVLCVGRVCKNKRTHIAYNIAIKLGMKCVIAGPIHESDYADEFIDNCTYLGNLSSTELRNLYTHAKITTCLTNVFPPETFGLFQVEALLCGSLVVSSCHGGLADTSNTFGVVKYSEFLSLEKNCIRIKKALNDYTHVNRNKSMQITKDNYTNMAVAQRYTQHINRDIHE